MPDPLDLEDIRFRYDRLVETTRVLDATGPAGPVQPTALR
jgi:hypothetical protein